jgi:hypothetical protein
MRYHSLLALLLLPAVVHAGDPGQAWTRLAPCALANAFATGQATLPPAGKYRGRVVWVDTAKFPRLRGAWLSAGWRGKEFFCAGYFTNRFPGFTALPSRGYDDTSWGDGQPVLALDYPTDYPLFGPNRDELRQVAPDVWLGRVWDRNTGQPTMWFVLSALGH